ncbi:POK9 protein, partial [Onychorhynchus coronatus]|nr:POK9 protein [Onychorhynchus coronatus]
RGSLGLDLATAVDITLKTTEVYKIPTGVTGPIYHENCKVGALLLGRSSTGTAGLIVLPEVIDADYTGEILIAAFTLHPPMVISKGTRIAQLVIYEKHASTDNGPTTKPARETRGFGSTGNMLVNLVQQMQQRPVVSLQLCHENDKHSVRAMLDTGADVNIFS